MPESPPVKEQVSQTRIAVHEASATTVRHERSPNVSRSLENVPQQPPTLPPVASLPGFTAVIPPNSTAAEIAPQTAARPFAMTSLLNPTADPEHPRQAQGVSQSPGHSVSAAYTPQQPPLQSPRIRKRGEDESPVRQTPAGAEQRQGRRMLTPKSPALRSMSQNVRGSPSSMRPSRGSIGSGEGRVYTVEPGDSITSAVPPLPPLARTPYPGYPPTMMHLEHPLSNAPQSHSNSSYSANTQGRLGSPSGSSNMAEREETSPYQQHLSEPTPRLTFSGGRAYGVNQPSYQMQLATDQGPMIVPVEVDIQQASKLADEKRKRNAGASARFRQRRKEKEQAAAATIAELQRQMREISEDRDFYLGERNALRDFISRLPGVQVPPRPPSPHLRRVQQPGQFVPVQSEPPPPYGQREIGEPSPAQRRRTSEYQPSFAPAPPHTPANYPQYPTHSQGPSFPLPPPSLPAPMSAQTPQSGIQTSVGQQQLQPPPHPPPPPGMRSQSYDPFRRDLSTR